jgi:hypothetical protein
MPGTKSDALTVVLDALAGLERQGETIEDDWQYVIDLTRTWRLKLERLGSADPITDVQAEAIGVVAAEAAAITDPHRAIDWLSTLPQIVLLAIGPA